MLSLFCHGIWSHHISSIIPFVSTAAGGGEDMPQILADVAKLSGPGWCPMMDDGSLKLRNGIRNAMEENRRWQQHVRERKKVFTIEDSVEWDEHIIVPLFVPLLLVFLTDSCESLALAAVRCTFNNGNLGQWLHRSLHRGGIRIRFT